MFSTTQCGIICKCFVCEYLREKWSEEEGQQRWSEKTYRNIERNRRVYAHVHSMLVVSEYLAVSMLQQRVQSEMKATG